jgi:hypothetical protein
VRFKLHELRDGFLGLPVSLASLSSINSHDISSVVLVSVPDYPSNPSFVNPTSFRMCKQYTYTREIKITYSANKKK